MSTITMAFVALLDEVQELDLKIDALSATLKSVEEGLGHDEAVISSRQEVESRQGHLQSMRRELQALELSAQSRRNHISDLESKLYGGTVRNPRELSDIQQDVVSLKRQLSAQDEEIIELMLQIDEADASLTGARSALLEIEEAWTKEQDELNAQYASLKQALEAVSKQREEKENGIRNLTVGAVRCLA